MTLRSATPSMLLASLAAFALVAVGCGGADTTGTASTSLTVATAQQAEAQGRWRRMHEPAQMVQHFDANHDGALQVTELPPRMQARLGEADADHDGVLAVTEITAHRAARRAAHFARVDTNSDGALTAEEVGPERWAHLGAADADHDNRVTRTELDAALASGALRGPMGGPHGEHGPMGGPHGEQGPMRGRGWGMGPRHAPDPARMTQRFDANGDGALQVTELPPRMQAHLGAADANHDGVLDATELGNAFAQWRAAHPEPSAPPADDAHAE